MKHYVGNKVCDSSNQWLELFLKLSMLHSWCWALCCHGTSSLEALFSLPLEVEISVPHVITQVDIHLCNAVLLMVTYDFIFSIYKLASLQLQGSLLRERGLGHPHQPLQEGLHHHVLSGPQAFDSSSTLLYSTSCVEFSVGEGASSLGEQHTFSMGGRGQHHHQHQGWHHHSVTVNLQLDKEAEQVSKFYETSIEKSFIPNFQNLSNHLYLNVCNSYCDLVSNYRPWWLVLPWNIM